MSIWNFTLNKSGSAWPFLYIFVSFFFFSPLHFLLLFLSGLNTLPSVRSENYAEMFLQPQQVTHDSQSVMDWISHSNCVQILTMTAVKYMQKFSLFARDLNSAGHWIEAFLEWEREVSGRHCSKLRTSRLCQFLLLNSPDFLASRTHYNAYVPVSGLVWKWVLARTR